ncbi:hypothetical protein [Tenacibaculum piscium]|uniref:hypothetical protein n=1 Tax=Tenacibaculum piscium TaxID=1458515 RepID=UPI00187B135D|nr:hypothetical protein [Tenacibaculum piscium]MBE7684973.1 hypothetical protein [Tenacibaculum piscium]MBE7689676.1 hypothetical protein [Tenacibaculum piscium]
MRKIFFMLCLITSSVFSQKEVNSYKYIIVEKKFDFLRTTDEYQTSSLTKFLFNKYGFTAFLADEKLPDDVAKNRCLALTATIVDDSGLLTTKNKVALKDCSNTLVFLSKVGKSREKNYKKAYHQAIRNAFKSIEALKYKYDFTDEIVLNTQIEKSPQQVQTDVIRLTATPVVDGFKLLNTSSEVILELLKTELTTIFILKNKKGILYKTNTTWTAEYYQNGRKIREKYQVKF